MHRQTPSELPVPFTRRRIFRLVPAALAGSAFPAVAQMESPELAASDGFHLEPKRIGSALTGMVEDGRAAGVSVLIWKDGREAYFGSAGFADREAERRITRDTIAQIYSMTKPVTGVALMRLWEAGKFGLDDPLSRYLPEFESMQVYAGKDAAGSPVYRAAARPISVRDVMRHTAGFAYGAGNTPAHEAYVKADPLALSVDLAEMGRRLAKVRCCSTPAHAGATASPSMSRHCWWRRSPARSLPSMSGNTCLSR